MNRQHEIEARLAQIRNDLETRGESMTAEEVGNLETEVRTLTEELNGLRAAAERRSALLGQIASGEGTTTRNFPEAGAQTAEQNTDPTASPEFRTAWLKRIRGIALTDAEQRAYSSAQNYGAEVIPQQTADQIITKMKKLAPMLGEITLLHVKGTVKFAVEGTNNAAAIHAENASITPAADTLAEVTLAGFEIIKLVQISDTVMTMSISAFEEWITDMLAESLARKCEDLIINGSGSSQPKGIEKANTWGATNSVTVAAASSLTAANVQALIGLLNAGYDRNAKFVMNKKTLFTQFMPLQDVSKYAIVTVQGGNYFVYGYPVLLSDYVADNVAYLGDFRKVVGNLAEQINVKSAYDINTNSYKYSGIAIFDCKPALGEAIVKLAKAS